MAPEQLYNFSMAREPADVYAIGKILYESVDSKMSDKVRPFKQVRNQPMLRTAPAFTSYRPPSSSSRLRP